ncbi:MAG: SHOCT domain-containing protein [Parcubacteria group bacterium]|nr:SHOCT domain-containing protein [Parcubacteria group bacterium]
MKKIFFITTFIFVFGFALFPGFSFAQGMMGFPSSSSDSAAIQSQQQEEQEGKQFLDNLNNKTVICSQLKDADFEKIGEYFMGQSIGDTSRHIAMNEMMKSMMGEQGEGQMHITWGKRGSGCDTSAAFPSQDVGFMPMMQMMMGGWPARNASQSEAGGSSPLGSNQLNNSMMNFGFTPFGDFGWIFMILWWALIIAGIVALIKWLMNQSRGSHDYEKPARPAGGSPLEILKERYAKGEIDRKEFEDKKKDLN